MTGDNEDKKYDTVIRPLRDRFELDCVRYLMHVSSERQMAQACADGKQTVEALEAQLRIARASLDDAAMQRKCFELEAREQASVLASGYGMTTKEVFYLGRDYTVSRDLRRSVPVRFRSRIEE